MIQDNIMLLSQDNFAESFVISTTKTFIEAIGFKARVRLESSDYSSAFHGHPNTLKMISR